ncbi:helix-turn-helix domain-containing protein [Nonomuraea sp. NPDC050786]|uniref:helix-turn-helix domain-containing protein n=1 Tax=Nonomuraea sp. NPDC050786 TaxID=3154840 RepID=UPI00340863F4
MEDTTSAFGEWVDQTARALGYRTDAQLADALGVQQSTVTRWRKGSQPQIKHLVGLAKLFKMKIEPLLALSGHVPPELLSDRATPEIPFTETVRRIREAPLDTVLKDALLRYWDQRLAEERTRVYETIKALQDMPKKPGHGIPLSAWAIAELTETNLPEHLSTLLAEVSNHLEAGDRRRKKRRRRMSPSASLTLPILSGSEGFVVSVPFAPKGHVEVILSSDEADITIGPFDTFPEAAGHVGKLLNKPLTQNEQEDHERNKPEEKTRPRER